MLTVQLSKTYPGFTLDTSFQADPSGITALFGRSGSGKSTLVNLLSGLAHPDSGRIVLNGETLFDGEKGINLPPEKRQIGYVFQESRLFPHMTVRKNLTYGMNLTPPNKRFIDFDHIVALLGIEHLLDRRPAKLSGGERQRIAIGRALLSSPRLLLMDEPLASLDATRKNEILPFIERLSDELALPIVYVSHDLNEVIRLADTMVLLSDGSVAAVGPVEDLTSRLDLYPLTGRYEAGAALSTTVAAHDENFSLTTLTFADREFKVPRIDLPIGAPLRLRVRARDVSLSLTRHSNTSILNILEGVIEEMNETGPSQLEVRIDVGAPIIARVTRRAAHDLDLKPGKTIFAMIKAIAIDRPSMGRRGGRKREE